MYATASDVAAGFRELTETEQERCKDMLNEAAVIIDSCAKTASDDVKRVVSCRMVRRQLSTEDAFPAGATQGTQSALGYSQSWTFGSGGASGELYLSKLEKKLLGVGNRLGSSSPVEGLC